MRCGIARSAARRASKMRRGRYQMVLDRFMSEKCRHIGLTLLNKHQQPEGIGQQGPFGGIGDGPGEPCRGGVTVAGEFGQSKAEMPLGPVGAELDGAAERLDVGAEGIGTANGHAVPIISESAR